MNLRVARVVVGFLLLIPAGAMHNTAREYATEPTSLARLATARSINFAASLMEMGAGALILIGAAPMVVSHFSRKLTEFRAAPGTRLALPPPQHHESTQEPPCDTAEQ